MVMRAWLTLLAILLLAAGHSSSGAARTPSRQGKTAIRPAVKAAFRLEALPSVVTLAGPRASQRLLVTALFPDGTRRDVTDSARFESATPRIATVSSDGEVLPRSDGRTRIVVRWSGRFAEVPAAVRGAHAEAPVSFVNEVVPLFSRLGCSQGTCHGAQQGKGGFRLSLRGYAPEIDFLSITRQLAGRRICREAPERSLLLRKPLAEIAHRGGKRFDRNSREFRLLLQWLREGAPGPSGKEPALAALQILPGDRFARPKMRQRLLVRATFADGHSEDVTALALYASNDLAVASVDESGLVTIQRAGETAVTAKYMDRLAVVRFTVPYGQTVSESAFRPRNNFVDDHVFAKLKQLHIEPSGLCTDAEFVRRAYIDALGTLPTAEEATAFLADSAPDRRERLVESLLQRPEFGLVWALKFGDLFVLRREYMHRKYAMALQAWLMEQFNSGRPWDRTVRDILTASGDLEENPGGLFYVSRSPIKPGEGSWIRAPEATGEMIAQVFLGTRIQCAKCHNHPTERYTQDDYYHFTALWQQVTGKGERDDGVPEKLEATANGDVRHPRTAELMSPRPLDRADLACGKEEDRRVKATAWIVRQEEFARNIVNRFWARCFGTGIVEPVDDIRSTNPAQNEPLMKALCDDLVAHHYDLKHLMATIMKSRTYQLTAKPNATNRTDTRLFSHYPARRIGAEELLDAVAQVTGVTDRFKAMAPGSRACELADAEIPSTLLDTFGRPPRVMPSDSERTCSPAISQALAMLNGEAIQQKIKSPDCALNTLLKSGKQDAEILDTLFLSALARHPSSEETAALLQGIRQAGKKEEGFQDVLWALLNSKEFLFVH